MRFLLVLLILFCTVSVSAQVPVDTAARNHDGQHDFDFEIGTWKTSLKRLSAPLSGSSTWVLYEGTTIVKPVWQGRANLVELDVAGASGAIKALSLRLYDPKTRQWGLNFANANGGGMAVPTIGSFVNGRGEFYNQDIYAGRSIFVRFIISPEGPDRWRFEQSFSEDGGKTWELNWVAIDTRVN